MLSLYEIVLANRNQFTVAMLIDCIKLIESEHSTKSRSKKVSDSNAQEHFKKVFLKHGEQSKSVRQNLANTTHRLFCTLFATIMF